MSRGDRLWRLAGEGGRKKRPRRKRKRRQRRRKSDGGIGGVRWLRRSNKLQIKSEKTLIKYAFCKIINK